MALRCKVGDMAIVLKGPMEGAIVNIDSFLGDKITDGGFFANLWHISVRGLNAAGNNLRCSQPDAWLLPIRPGDLHETEETEKELTV